MKEGGGLKLVRIMDTMWAGLYSYLMKLEYLSRDEGFYIIMRRWDGYAWRSGWISVPQLAEHHRSQNEP